ncbi:MAG: rod shape-determining protein MreC [Rhodospirillales bacterium]|nr:rod shape-determining protein MreC [Rhodospirillales bacterium]
MKHRTKKIGGKIGSKALIGVALPPLFSSAGAGGLMVFVALCLMLISTLQPQMLSGLRTGTADMASPVLNVVSAPIQKAAIFVRDVTGLAALQAENARLLEENTKLREWYQTALLLEAENQSLRELMSVKLDTPHTYITARILSDSTNTFAKSLLVSAGRADGVKKNQAVVAADGLIGRVVEAGENTARVLLITDMNSRVPVIIEGSRQHAIFAGQNDRNGTLVHLPPETEVSKGARVVTSGIGGVFPVGLPVGIVSETQGKIVIEPFANFNRLMHVRIVNKPDDPNLRPGGL